jgi:hypothetical protein
MVCFLGISILYKTLQSYTFFLNCANIFRKKYKINAKIVEKVLSYQQEGHTKRVFDRFLIVITILTANYANLTNY